jgi:excisionase family DNA binding protein
MTATLQQTPEVNLPAEIFNDEQTAFYLGVESRTLRLWRRTRGLPHIRITGKVIRYRKADLDKWLNQHRVAINRGAA